MTKNAGMGNLLGKMVIVIEGTMTVICAMDMGRCHGLMVAIIGENGSMECSKEKVFLCLYRGVVCAWVGLS